VALSLGEARVAYSTQRSQRRVLMALRACC
jgi:hypothetical protein